MRKWIANKLASLARRIYPQSEEVMAFHMDRMFDLIMTGQSTVKVSRVDAIREGDIIRARVPPEYLKSSDAASPRSTEEK